MTVHVSIHDVSPAFEDEIELALEAAHARGVRPALLVVPDFHGRASLANHPAYCERLRKLQTTGHEVFLHGYFHQARPWDEHARTHVGDPRVGGGVAAKLRYLFAQKVASASEAEFSDVTPSEARVRLDDGERMLREAGLSIRGFVAPAWSMAPWVLELLAERHYAFTEDHTRIYDPVGRRSRASVVLNYASRTPARLLSSVGWCRVAREARRVVPARIAIHPADMRYAMLRHEIDSLLDWGSGDFADTAEGLFR